MIKISPNPTFQCRVAISSPGIENQLEFGVTFRHKTKDAVAAWINSAVGRADVDVLADVIDGWSDVTDENGAAVPYSAAALSDLLQNYPAAHQEIFRAYLRELTESKRKN
jgi:hypothetical protein